MSAAYADAAEAGDYYSDNGGDESYDSRTPRREQTWVEGSGAASGGRLVDVLNRRATRGAPPPESPAAP